MMDIWSFTDRYKLVYKDLYRFALCMMRHQQDAEDAVSEAVLSAYENIHKLRKEEAFKSWIFQILANVCKKKLRSADRKEVQLYQEEAVRSDDTAEGTETEAIKNARGEEMQGVAEPQADLSGKPMENAVADGLREDVRKAFFILSEEEQFIVSLSVFGGYNSKEIGEMFQMNASTVRSKRKRALEKMSLVLKEVAL
ncbi:RNA polymerase sigma factor [Roseburia hominis]